MSQIQPDDERRPGPVPPPPQVSPRADGEAPHEEVPTLRLPSPWRLMVAALVMGGFLYFLYHSYPEEPPTPPPVSSETNGGKS